MQELWEIKLPKTDEFKFNYNGKFIRLDKDILFIYKNRNDVIILKIDSINQNQVYINIHFDILDIPWYWFFFKKEGQYLICSDRYAINLHTLQKEKNKKIFNLHEAVEYRFECKNFIFDSYCIEHYGSFGYVCKNIETNTILWKIKLKGYLYSDIVRYNQQIFICTAEHGGYVYSVDLATGKIIFEIYTKGTAYIELCDKYLYCYKLGKKGELLKIDIDSGKITENIQLAEITLDCPLKLLDKNKILTMSFSQQPNGLYVPIIKCFSLD